MDNVEPLRSAFVAYSARLQLHAERLGWTFGICTDSCELVELIELAGLTDVLSVEVRR